MPNAGDGLTVVSAMRHSNPDAVTLLHTSFPEMDAAARAILLQADDILVKPISATRIVQSIRTRLEHGPKPPPIVESVAQILFRSSHEIVQHWFERVANEPKLMAVPMNFELRSRHLPEVIGDLVVRLTSLEPLGTKALRSVSSIDHGILRRRQLYSADMLVEESRLLQVSVFEALQNNLETIDFSVVLLGVMTIADEIDSQLSQAMESYIAESVNDLLPA
jgi:CheY-like chemotaxis protein